MLVIRHRRILKWGASSAQSPQLMVREVPAKRRAAAVEAREPADQGGEGLGDAENLDLPADPAVALKMSFPETVQVQTESSLLIELTDRPDQPGTLPFSAEEGELIDVIASPVSGFSVVGRAEGTIAITHAYQPIAIQIKLRAETEGLGEVRVLAFRNRSPIGTISIMSNVVAGEPTSNQSIARLAIPATPRVEADLNLVITQEIHRGRLALKYVVSTADGRLNLTPFGPHTIDIEPGAHIHGIFDEIEKMPQSKGRWDKDKAQRIERLGVGLTELLMPADLQAVLWGVRNRISSIFIQTDEPWIPWELCRLSGKVGGRNREGPFLCEKYDLSRWYPGIGLKMELTAKSLGYIAPPGADLPGQIGEVEMLRGLQQENRNVVDIGATYEEVLRAFGSAGHDVIHFAGHGANTDRANASRSQLDLTGDDLLHPTDISGRVKNLGRANPLVFLNACQLGQSSMGLHGIAGWAQAFVGAGASAFVGSHWSVSDGRAAQFAEEFYRNALQGSTLARSVRLARLAIRDKADPSWLSYTLVAAPNACVAS